MVESVDRKDMEITGTYFRVVRAPKDTLYGIARTIARVKTLKAARRIRDRKDLEYGSAVHGIEEWNAFPSGNVRHPIVAARIGYRI